MVSDEQQGNGTQVKAERLSVLASGDRSAATEGKGGRCRGLSSEMMWSMCLRDETATEMHDATSDPPQEREPS